LIPGAGDNSPAMPEVSVLIATFRRRELLQRALDSVYKQDFSDYELVVVDDCSPDDTPKLMHEMQSLDPRIRYIRLEENIGSKYGDREILRRFAAYWARGEYFIYLCDDDYWIPKDLLSRSVDIMRKHPSVVQVMGAQVQIYPTTVMDIPLISDYWHYEAVPDIPNGLAMMGIFPEGLIQRDDFLELQCQDPVTRNVLTGASLFRKSAFARAGVLATRKGAQWQAGYELTTGIATQGDSYYFDRPSIAAGVDINSASFRGTQLSHLMDCLKSVSIAFRKPKHTADAAEQERLGYLERKMKHAILFNYLRNKIGFHLGWFGSKLLPEIKNIFQPEISGLRFFWLAYRHRLPLSEDNKLLIRISMAPSRLIPTLVEKQVERHGVTEWHKVMSKWPSEEAL